MAWYLNAALLSLAIMFFTFRVLVYYEPVAVPLHKIRFPALLFGLVLLWALIQTIPLDMQTFADTKQVIHPAWQMASETLSAEVSGSISANRQESWIGILRLLTYAGVFWLVLQLGRDSEKAQILLYAVVTAITLYATYGLILKVLGSETILWFDKEFYKDSLTATFINRNSAATYFGLGCVALSGLLIHHLRKHLTTGAGMRFFFSRLIQAVLLKKSVLLIYALFICFSALILTGSRAGILATFLALICLFISYILKQRSSAIVYMTLLATFIVMLITISELGGALFADRLQDVTGSDADTRFNAYFITFNAIKNYIWTGTGLGTFADIFPIYRDETISTVWTWDKAHNTYLELVLELGLPFAVALVLCVVLLIGRAFKGFIERRQSSHYCAIGIAASVLVGTHALVDFSLQIQAVTFAYVVLLSLAVSQSWSGKRQNL